MELSAISHRRMDSAFALDRIRAERNDREEQARRTQASADLDVGALPPCIAESGGLMSPREWSRVFRHPYKGIPLAEAKHGPPRPTRDRSPEYSTFAVPFGWMLNENQRRIQEGIPVQLRKLKARLAPWIDVPTEPRPNATFIDKLGPPDDGLAAVKAPARTDASMTAAPPAAYPHGTTE
jgi:hypothetical protein